MNGARLNRMAVLAAAMATSAATFGAGVTITPVFVSGQQAPGMDPGVTIVGAGLPNIGDGGHIVIDTFVSGPGIMPGEGGVGYAGLPGALSIFYRGGAPVPSLGPDVVYAENISGFRSIPNSAGDFLFMTTVLGPGVDGSNEGVIAMRQGGTTS